MDWNPDPEIQSGSAQLWSVNQGQLIIITRVERSELVVVAAEGKNLVAACIYLLAAAKNQGLKTVRYHTIKPAFARLVKRHFPNFKEIETRSCGERVYRMSIPNG